MSDHQETEIERLRQRLAAATKDRDEARNMIANVVKLCDAALKRYKQVGSQGMLASVPIAAVRDQLGLPPFTDFDNEEGKREPSAGSR